MTENTPFKMSDKAFYRSRFSGMLPCEIVEVGAKKIRILIEGYNSKLWVSKARIISSAEFASMNERPFANMIKKIKQKLPIVAIQQTVTVLQELHKD